MADFTGTLGSPMQYAVPAQVTARVFHAPEAFGGGRRQGSGLWGQPAARGHPSVLAPAARAGLRRGAFGEYWFERIHLVPSVKALGSILSTVTFPAEVWNAFRDDPETLSTITLNGIAVTDAEGVSVIDPYGTPLVFRPLQSRDYSVRVSSSGTPQVSVAIVWQFAEVPDPSLLVTGTRLVLFSPPIDWGQPWHETLAWLTDVVTADDDREQRIMLRTKPRRTLTYTVVTLDERESALLDNLLWGYQPQPFGVPIWPDAVWLAAPVAVDDITIHLDPTQGTTGREFHTDGTAVLYRDAFTWEAVTIDAVGATSLTLAQGAKNAWGKGETKVIPITIGTTTPHVERTRPSVAATDMEVSFVCDVLTDAPLVAATGYAPAQFRGLDVLATMPNRVAPPKHTLTRTMILQDSTTGVFSYLAPTPAPVASRDFAWLLEGKPAIQAFKGFLAARQGRLTCCWVPTWARDVQLVKPALATDNTLMAQDAGYARLVFGTSSARQFLGVVAGDERVTPLVVANAVSNGDGTETLTLAAPLGQPVDSETSMLAWLTVARLASDDVELVWHTPHVVEVAAELVEVPSEAPAP